MAAMLALFGLFLGAQVRFVHDESLFIEAGSWEDFLC